MTENNKKRVTRGTNLTNDTNLILYRIVIKQCKGMTFRMVRLRLAIFLLALTEAKINELLILKVQNLRTLQKKFVIEIKNETIVVVENEKVRKIIAERWLDIQYIYKIKDDKDFIFTRDIESPIPLRRETLTRILNKKLNFIGINLQPPRKLTSKDLKNLQHRDSTPKNINDIDIPNQCENKLSIL